MPTKPINSTILKTLINIQECPLLYSQTFHNLPASITYTQFTIIFKPQTQSHLDGKQTSLNESLLEGDQFESQYQKSIYLPTNMLLYLKDSHQIPKWIRNFVYGIERIASFLV
ncbi:hypothetical protein GWI33_015944 [Rhynchophorus ferrugineus]|uniref:Uncharacterized protein n=1 Tax=Rhynchophorus ferrugineus TaxID=354439 RepID=A0A834M5G4_RHYFE|nr:hypothetical protein GWI33_015944 [Rhynchophorus ferrugineus]